MKLGAMVSTTAVLSPKYLAASAISAGVVAVGDTLKSFLTKKGEKTLEKVILEFRKTLSVITSELYSNGKNRLIFIIDELDRCRPSFAVETIEKIKHLFSVSGIIWVLVVNREQLKKTINHVYGTGESNQYLDKFIHVNTMLPKTPPSYPLVHYPDHYKELISQATLKIPYIQDIKDVLIIFSRKFEISIRDLQRVIFYMNLLFDKTNYYYERWYIVLGTFLSIIKVVNSELYSTIKTKKISYDEIIKYDFIVDYGNKEDASLHMLKYYIGFALISNPAIGLYVNGGVLNDTHYNKFRELETDYIQNASNRINQLFKKLEIFSFV